MGKRKISAKQAVEAIRSGMDDSALMKEYGLAPSGLQSLFDKLVTGGYLDLAEVQARMPGFMETVNISDPFYPIKEDGTRGAPESRTGRSEIWINAQEAARDIREGLDDDALMRKYRLTSRGLRSMVDKLIGVGLIKQADLDQRRLGIQENTVALSGEMLDFADLLRHLELPAQKKAVQPEALKPVQITRETIKVTSFDKTTEKPQQVEQAPRMVELHWYDDPFMLVLTLIGLFPLGFYALYLNSQLPKKSKAIIIVAWTSLVVVGLELARECWSWFPGF